MAPITLCFTLSPSKTLRPGVHPPWVRKNECARSAAGFCVPGPRDADAQGRKGLRQGKLRGSAEGSQTCVKNCKGTRSEVTIRNANVI
jgi:hypothetical protein